MAKAKTLFQKAQELAPRRAVGAETWYERMERDEPEKFGELNELIDAFIDNEEQILTRIPTKHSMAKHLIDTGVLTVREQAIVRYIDQRRAGRGKKNTA